MNKKIDEIIEQIKTAINFKKQPIPMDYNISIYDMEQLLDYITNLQEENEQLKNELKSIKENYKIQLEYDEQLENKIDKAIEHLHKRNEQNSSALTNKEETIISKHELLKLENINNKILEDILRSEDNANRNI